MIASADCFSSAFSNKSVCCPSKPISFRKRILPNTASTTAGQEAALAERFNSAVSKADARRKSFKSLCSIPLTSCICNSCTACEQVSTTNPPSLMPGSSRKSSNTYQPASLPPLALAVSALLSGMQVFHNNQYPGVRGSPPPIDWKYGSIVGVGGRIGIGVDVGVEPQDPSNRENINRKKKPDLTMASFNDQG